MGLKGANTSKSLIVIDVQQTTLGIEKTRNMYSANVLRQHQYVINVYISRYIVY